jgi:hypothetical protein
VVGGQVRVEAVWQDPVARVGNEEEYEDEEEERRELAEGASLLIYV